MQKILIISWIVSALFGAASWLICGLWIAGTPRKPRFSISFVGQYWDYRRARKAADAQGQTPPILTVFQWLFAASLLSAGVAMILTIAAVLNAE